LLSCSDERWRNRRSYTPALRFPTTWGNTPTPDLLAFLFVSVKYFGAMKSDTRQAIILAALLALLVFALCYLWLIGSFYL